MESKVDTTITWVINNFSSLQSASICSDQFVVGGFKWRLLAFPKGNMKADHLSLFLEVPDRESLPIGWRRHAKFSLTLVNHYSQKLSQLRETQKWFDHKAPNLGYDMITLTELHAKKGFLVNGELTVVAKIDVNGFQVFPSQVESVKCLFEGHLDIASKFRPKNSYLKTAYMNVLFVDLC